MKRKTILALSLAAAAVTGAAVAIPAVAGGWGGGPCGAGFGSTKMMGHKAGYGPMNNPIFRSFDIDKDGTVNADEARTGLTTLHSKYDSNADGVLAADEFAVLFAEATRGFSERPFDMLDENGDGKLSAEEMTFPARMMARFAPWQNPAPNEK